MSERSEQLGGPDSPMVLGDGEVRKLGEAYPIAKSERSCEIKRLNIKDKETLLSVVGKLVSMGFKKYWEDVDLLKVPLPMSLGISGNSLDFGYFEIETECTVDEFLIYAQEKLKEYKIRLAGYSRQDIFAELDAERIRQDAKWGEQNWDMVTDTEKENSKDLEKIYKGICDIRAINKTSTWFAILLEEVFEAFAEDMPERQYDELVQAGAVIVSMLECLRRKGVKV